MEKDSGSCYQINCVFKFGPKLTPNNNFHSFHSLLKTVSLGINHSFHASTLLEIFHKKMEQAFLPSQLPPPPPPPPPPGLIDLTPPPIFQGSYTLHHQRKHLALINGQGEFASSKEQVEAKCKKQLQQAEKTAKETQSTGEKELRNLQICTKCQKCGHWIENEQFKTHKSFHAAHIIQGLLLGDKVCSMSKKQLLQRNKVTHIVNAAIELKNHFQAEGVKYINLKLYDEMDEQVIDEAIRAAEFIKQAKDEGGVVFVHCAMGKSRSVSAIVMYLMLHHQLDYQESLKLIRVNRPMAKPNLSYEKQLKQFYSNKYQS